MRKVPFVIFFILLSNNIFAQGFGLTIKSTFHVGTSYSSYTNLSLEGLFSFYDNMFEVGPIIGIVYSEPKPNFDNITLSGYYYTDVVDIAKILIGGKLYFYPITFNSTFAPFIGVSVGKLSDSKSLLFFLKSGDNMIMQSGLYNFKTIDDYSYSFLSGLKIFTTKGFNFFLELEFQYRKFTLEYDEYWEYPIDEWIEHSEKMSIKAFNIGVGLQFVF
ncbi:MAG: hypothetical protein L3J41_06175 [Melioribacteraceae bacterium]|nr:hypothetical protein [Melioribacteraceae bacterium]